MSAIAGGTPRFRSAPTDAEFKASGHILLEDVLMEVEVERDVTKLETVVYVIFRARNTSDRYTIALREEYIGKKVSVPTGITMVVPDKEKEIPF